MSEQELVDRIFALQRGEDVALTEADAPADHVAGLAVQVQVLDRWLAAGETLGGWKVGFSAGAARGALEEGFRPFGFVLASRIFAGGDVVERPPFETFMIETEICLTLGEPLSGPDVTAEQARAAVRSVSPAFELVAVRVPMVLPLLFADGGAAWGLVVGDGVDPDSVDLSTLVATTYQDGDERETMAADGHLDDPYLSLARICHSLDRFGLGLEAGQPVATGAFSALPVTGPGSWSADLGRLGSIQVTFA